MTRAITAAATASGSTSAIVRAASPATTSSYGGASANALLAEIVVGAAGVSAMAIQTAVTRLAGYLFPTNMVTGTMTMLGMDTAGLLFRLHNSPQERAASRRRAREYARVVGGFAAGAVLGAVTTSYLQFWAAGVPLLVIVLGAAQELTTGIRSSEAASA